MLDVERQAIDGDTKDDVDLLALYMRQKLMATVLLSLILTLF